MKDIFSRIKQAVGTDAELARRLGISRQMVWNWKSRGRIPPEWVLKVELATERQVTRYDIAPNLYPRERVA